MKRILALFIFSFITVFINAPIIHASEITTTTEPIITTIEVTEEETDAVVEFYENLTFTNIMQIISFAYMVLMAVIVLKQRVEVAVAKYKEKVAKSETDIDKNVLVTVLGVVSNVQSMLNMVVQASKMKTEDKMTVATIFNKDSALVSNLANLLEDKANVSKNDTIGILGAVTDLASIVGEGINAAKTGNIQSMLSKYAPINNNPTEPPIPVSNTEV